MISKELQKSIDKRNEKLAAALQEELDDDDDRRIRGAQSSLLYIVSTGDEGRIYNELTKIDQNWAVWATTGSWPLFEMYLQGRVDNLMRALDDALLEEHDADDQHKILAAKARLVAVIAAEDPERAQVEVDQTMKDHAAWATSGTWPALTIKPSKPPRPSSPSEPVNPHQDDLDDIDEKNKPKFAMGTKLTLAAVGLFVLKIVL